MLAEIREHVTGIASTSGHFFTGCTNLTERFTIVCHIRQDDQHMHTQFEGEVFRSCKGETRGDDTLDGGVVCEVKEDDGTFESPVRSKSCMK